MSDGLTTKIVGLHRALDVAQLPHAFGGALALAFCTREPRGTKDIDLNVFVGVDRLDELVAALPAAVAITEADRTAFASDGQSRLWWERTPVDVFLSNTPFHDHVAASVRHVPFAEVEELPILACGDLAVFKAFFDRAKDAVDVAEMVKADALDLGHVRRTVDALRGDARRDRFFARVADALSD
jgi:hypothetical protein